MEHKSFLEQCLSTILSVSSEPYSKRLFLAFALIKLRQNIFAFGLCLCLVKSSALNVRT